MSRFSGPQGKGALREYKRKQRENNFRRELLIWNNGTGLIIIKQFSNQDDPRILDKTKRVANPLFYLKKVEREHYEKFVTAFTN